MSAVYKAISAVMAEMSKTGIGKDRRNQQQNFAYRGVDDIMNALASVLVEKGLLVFPRVTKYSCTERLSGAGKPLFYTVLEVEYDFVGVEDGSTHTAGPFIGEAMDSGDKSANKAMSVAYKYACIQTFCIPTEGDNDPDSTAHDVQPKPWDGREQVGYSSLKDCLWRDAPDDFLVFTETNKVPPEVKANARREKERRMAERDALHAKGSVR